MHRRLIKDPKKCKLTKCEENTMWVIWLCSGYVVMYSVIRRKNTQVYPEHALVDVYTAFWVLRKTRAPHNENSKIQFLHGR